MKNELVILFGSGRSGTSWLHMMLAAHPAIVSGQQSRLFERYLYRIDQGWRTEVEQAETGAGRIHGIACFLSEDELVGLIRNFADGLYSKLDSLKEGARITLDNQPGDARSLPLIARCFPSVKFIHLMRDGRDAALSLMLGYKGYDDVPDMRSGALWWRERMDLAEQNKHCGAGTLDVRFEDLNSNGPAELRRVFDFLCVECSDQQAQAIYEEYRIENVRSGKHRSPFVNPGPVKASGTSARPEPKGFFRSGKSNQWKELLSRGDLQVFNEIAGEALVRAGYRLADVSEVPASRQSIVPQRRRIKIGLRKLGGRVLRQIGLIE